MGLIGRTLSRLLIPVVIGGLTLALTTLALVPQARELLTAGSAGEINIDLAALPERSVVYAADGSVLAVFAEENRTEVTLDLVPSHVINAVLSAEDERFFEHGALDWRAMARALVTNIESGDVVEGGSTITQQLVKNALLTPDRDLKRKLQEASLAIRLERQMSKEEILERYLNIVYFGNGAYGIQAAAEIYYGIGAHQLSLGQGVLLASLIRNPSGGDPWNAPEAARSRRDIVIDRMDRLGHLQPGEAEALKAEPLPERPPDRAGSGVDYFVEAVRRALLEDERLGPDEATRQRALLRGGLAIHTTIDPALQRVAEAKVAEILPDSEGRFTASLVSVEPGTGAVRALVGGPDFTQDKFNLVTQGGRQTGSLFKALTLVAGLEAGYLPEDRILASAPCEIANPGGDPDPWLVRNAGGAPAVMTLSDATARSVNCAYARLVKLVGAAALVDVAARMGIVEPLAPNLSLALGTASVTPLEMATVYATLANDGVRNRPHFVARIEKGGEVLFSEDPAPSQVVEVEVARTATQVLTRVVAPGGTGTAAAVPGWQVSGKTGSTDDNADAWFAGSTPDLTTVVWMGAPEGRVEMANVGGIRVFGGSYPARIFGAFMTEALAGREPRVFPVPSSTTTRPPRLLLLPGERPPAPPPEEPSVDDVDGGDPLDIPRIRLPDVTIPDITRPSVPRPSIPQVTIPPRPERPTSLGGFGTVP